MKNGSGPSAKIALHTNGLGVPSTDTVRTRALELARIDGRTDYNEADWEQAKREVHGGHPGLWSDDGYSVMFNKATGIWGTQYEQNKDKDALTVKAEVKTGAPAQEVLTYTIDKSGLISLLWGDMVISLKAQ